MCPACRGTRLCQECGGRGTVQPGDGEGSDMTACPLCFDPALDKGTGVCQICHGLGEMLD